MNRADVHDGSSPRSPTPIPPPPTREPVSLQPKQAVFATIFGMILPALCFLFDPLIFRDVFSGGIRPGLLVHAILTYTLVGLSILGLFLHVAWFDSAPSLVRGIRLGLIFIGCTVSTVFAAIFVPILPLSIFASLALIGLLGFVPFFTVVVYFKALFREVRLDRERRGQGRFNAQIVAVVVVLLVLGAGMSMFSGFERMAGDLEFGDPARMERAMGLLAGWGELGHGTMQRSYPRLSGEAQARVRAVYLDLTGKDIQQVSRDRFR